MINGIGKPGDMVELIQYDEHWRNNPNGFNAYLGYQTRIVSIKEISPTHFCYELCDVMNNLCMIYMGFCKVISLRRKLPAWF